MRPYNRPYKSHSFSQISRRMTHKMTGFVAPWSLPCRDALLPAAKHPAALSSASKRSAGRANFTGSFSDSAWPLSILRKRGTFWEPFLESLELWSFDFQVFNPRISLANSKKSKVCVPGSSPATRSQLPRADPAPQRRAGAAAAAAGCGARRVELVVELHVGVTADATWEPGTSTGDSRLEAGASRHAGYRVGLGTLLKTHRIWS